MALDSSLLPEIAEMNDVHTLEDYVLAFEKLREQFPQPDSDAARWMELGEKLCRCSRDIAFACLREGTRDADILIPVAQSLREAVQSLDRALCGLSDSDLRDYRAHIADRAQFLQDRIRPSLVKLLG